MKTIPVDTSKFAGFMLVKAPAPKVNPMTKEARTDTATGLPVFEVQVCEIRAEENPTVIKVSVVGEPRGLTVPMFVRLIDLEATSWEMEGRSGVAFKAAAVVPMDGSDQGAARRPAGAPAGPPASGPARGGDAN